MKKRKPIYYVIPRAEIEQQVAISGVDFLLDMLRYDASTPQPNAPEGYYLFRIDPDYVLKEPEVARWASFGVVTVLPFDPEMWRIDFDQPFLKTIHNARAWAAFDAARTDRAAKA